MWLWETGCFLDAAEWKRVRCSSHSIGLALQTAITAIVVVRNQLAPLQISESIGLVLACPSLCCFSYCDCNGAGVEMTD